MGFLRILCPSDHTVIFKLPTPRACSVTESAFSLYSLWLLHTLFLQPASLPSYIEERFSSQESILHWLLGKGFFLVLSSVISYLINPLIILTFQLAKKTAQIELYINTGTAFLLSRFMDVSSLFFFFKVGFCKLM